MSVQFNPFEKKWEIFDQSSTEDRNELTFDFSNSFATSLIVDKGVLSECAAAAACTPM